MAIQSGRSGESARKPRASASDYLTALALRAYDAYSSVGRSELVRFAGVEPAPPIATYVAHLRDHVVPNLVAIPGYVSVTLLRQDLGELVEVTVMTTWESMDAIRAFAGDDVERAVVADEAAAILADYDRRVRHCEVVRVDHESGQQ